MVPLDQSGDTCFGFFTFWRPRGALTIPIWSWLCPIFFKGIHVVFEVINSMFSQATWGFYWDSLPGNLSWKMAITPWESSLSSLCSSHPSPRFAHRPSKIAKPVAILPMSTFFHMKHTCLLYLIRMEICLWLFMWLYVACLVMSSHV